MVHDILDLIDRITPNTPRKPAEYLTKLSKALKGEKTGRPMNQSNLNVAITTLVKAAPFTAVVSMHEANLTGQFNAWLEARRTEYQVTKSRDAEIQKLEDKLAQLRNLATEYQTQLDALRASPPSFL